MCHDSTQLLSCWHSNIASLWIYLLSITHCIHFFKQKYLFPTAIDSSTLTHILLLILITAFFTFIVKSCGHQWLFYMVLIKQVLDSTALAGSLIISLANLILSLWSWWCQVVTRNSEPGSRWCRFLFHFSLWLISEKLLDFPPLGSRSNHARSNSKQKNIWFFTLSSSHPYTNPYCPHILSLC